MASKSETTFGDNNVHPSWYTNDDEMERRFDALHSNINRMQSFIALHLKDATVERVSASCAFYSPRGIPTVNATLTVDGTSVTVSIKGY